MLRGRSRDTFLQMQESNAYFTGFYVFTFVSAAVILVMGLIIAVLTNTFKLVRQQIFYHTTVDMHDYEMIDFMMKRFKKYIGITKPKPVSRRTIPTSKKELRVKFDHFRQKFDQVPSLQDIFKTARSSNFRFFEGSCTRFYEELKSTKHVLAVKMASVADRV